MFMQFSGLSSLSRPTDRITRSPVDRPGSGASGRAPAPDIPETSRPLFFNSAPAQLTPDQYKVLHGIVSQINKEMRGDSSYEKLTELMEKYFPQDGKFKPGQEFLSRFVMQTVASDIRGRDQTKSRTLLDTQARNLIIGPIQVRFNKTYEAGTQLALINFDELLLPEDIQKDFPSKIVGVVNMRSNDIVAKDGNRAVFPEHFQVRLDRQDNPDGNSYIFVDRFVDDAKLLTIPAVKAYVENPDLVFYNQLKENDKALRYASLLRVAIHENGHSHGEIPRVLRPAEDVRNPGFKIKDAFYTGSVEELKVDLRAMLSPWFGPNFDKYDSVEDIPPYSFPKIEGVNYGKDLFEFLLGERLIRYPMMFEPADNFDSASSHILLNYLLETKVKGERVLAIEDNKLKFMPDRTLAETLDEDAKSQIRTEYRSILREAIFGLYKKIVDAETATIASFEELSPEGGFSKNQIDEQIRAEIKARKPITDLAKKYLNYKADQQPFYLDSEDQFQINDTRMDMFLDNAEAKLAQDHVSDTQVQALAERLEKLFHKYNQESPVNLKPRFKGRYPILQKIPSRITGLIPALQGSRQYDLEINRPVFKSGISQAAAFANENGIANGLRKELRNAFVSQNTISLDSERLAIDMNPIYLDMKKVTKSR